MARVLAMPVSGAVADAVAHADRAARSPHDLDRLQSASGGTDRAHRPDINMRSRLLVACLTALPLFAACAADGDEGPSPYDDDAPVQAGDINEGAPANSSLPDDNKSDAQYPAKFELGDQSPVKSQGSRGVCSIFSATAQIENLYIKAG